VGERAEQPKVPAMRSIVGMAAEGGTVLKLALPRVFKQSLRPAWRRIHPFLHLDGVTGPR